MTASIPSLASHLIVGISGPELTSSEDRWLRRHQPGGVILFARNVTGPGQLRQLCAKLHDALPAPAEIVADHEGGAISVLAAATGRPPAPFTLGKLDDVELTRSVHAATGERLAASGIDRVLAPCADVLYEPRNPVIGQRAFGSEAALVERHVDAAVRGLVEGGMRCCLKHWPGHGASSRDSHLGPVAAVVQDDDSVYLAGINAGCDGLLVGHLPLGPEEDASPATLDCDALQRARSLGAGLRLYADDITMGALRTILDAPEAAELPDGLLPPERLPEIFFARLAKAGCDRLLCRGIPWRAFPLDQAACEPVTVSGSASPDAAPAPAWIEARRAAATAEGLLPRSGGEEELLWLDTTCGDRWGEAELGWVLPEHYSAIRRIEPGAPAGPTTAPTTLLVTSHRPLEDAVLANLATVLDGPPLRFAVIMGHPSLTEAIRPLLPPECGIRALYDIRAVDLELLFEGRDGK